MRAYTCRATVAELPRVVNLGDILRVALTLIYQGTKPEGRNCNSFFIVVNYV